MSACRGKHENYFRNGQIDKKGSKIKYVYYNDVSVLAVYPGTEIYEIAKKNGMIDDNYWLTDKPNPIFTLEHSEEKNCFISSEFF